MLHSHVCEVLLLAAEHANDRRLVRCRKRTRHALRVCAAQTWQVVRKRRDEGAADDWIDVVYDQDVFGRRGMPVVVVHHVAANVPPQQLTLFCLVWRKLVGGRLGPRTRRRHGDLVEESLVEPRLHLVHVRTGRRDEGGKVPVRNLIPLGGARTERAHERMVVRRGIVHNVHQVLPLRTARLHRRQHVYRGDGLHRLVALFQSLGVDGPPLQRVVECAPRTHCAWCVHGRLGEETGDLELVALVVNPPAAQRGGNPEVEHVKTIFEPPIPGRGGDEIPFRLRKSKWPSLRAGKPRKRDSEIRTPHRIREPGRRLNRQP